MPDVPIRGSVVFLMLYDLCEEIRLPEVRRIFRLQPAGREPSFKHTAPEYLRFEQPPMVEQFNQSRAFVLELLVVVILIAELVALFWPPHVR